jgi:hypothetical protein
MFSKIHDRAYQEFLTLLKNFPNSSLDKDFIINTTIWNERFAELKTLIDKTIIPITQAALNSHIESPWQSISIEIDREFRLLGTDILFLNSARQSTTKLARAKTIDNRIEKLIFYTQELLQRYQLKNDIID